jgi:hypothetical protein
VDGFGGAAAEQHGDECGQVRVHPGLTGEHHRTGNRRHHRAHGVQDVVDGGDLVPDEVRRGQTAEDDDGPGAAQVVERRRQLDHVEAVEQRPGKQRQPGVQA